MPACPAPRGRFRGPPLSAALAPPPRRARRGGGCRRGAGPGTFWRLGPAVLHLGRAEAPRPAAPRPGPAPPPRAPLPRPPSKLPEASPPFSNLPCPASARAARRPGRGAALLRSRLGRRSRARPGPETCRRGGLGPAGSGQVI